MKKFGFSWKRALGITTAKRRVAKMTGIPTTKQGRKRKAARLLTGGCLTYVLIFVLMLSTCIVAFAHPGRTDANGGHTVNADGWGYEIGTYHTHDEHGNIIPVDKDTLAPTEISVVVNGEKIMFDQPPEVINGRTMVPIRYVVEKMDCTVEWDEATQTVYVNSAGVALDKVATLGDNINVYVNNDKIIFEDQQPVTINGRVLLPVRFVADKLGYSVGWDESMQIVKIDKI